MKNSIIKKNLGGGGGGGGQEQLGSSAAVVSFGIVQQHGAVFSPQFCCFWQVRTGTNDQGLLQLGDFGPIPPSGKADMCLFPRTKKNCVFVFD